MARKRGYRGTIGKILAHGGSLGLALDQAANDWIAGVNSSRAFYEQGLGEYLTFYIPRIEQEYLNLVNSTQDYFKDTSRFNREQTAVKIMEATHELAAEWKAKRAQDIIKAKMTALGAGGGFAGSYGIIGRVPGARSNESPNVVKVKSLTL